MNNYSLVGRSEDNFIVVDEAVNAGGLTIEIKGRGNRVIIEEGCTLNETFIRFWGNNNHVHISRKTKICGRFLFDGDEQQLLIGESTTFERVNIVLAEGCSVSIGKDCMLSFGIQIRTSDAHSVLDATTRVRTNPSKNIFIDDHVWVGAEAIIQKGSSIPKNSIVGIRSVVAGAFINPNVAIAGIPAKIVKENIDWDRKLI